MSRRYRQRQTAEAARWIAWAPDDEATWPLPDRHAGDFGPPDDTDSEGGETDCEVEQQ